WSSDVCSSDLFSVPPTITIGSAFPITGCRSAGSSALWSRWPSSAWPCTPTAPCAARACPTPTCWRCTGPWAAPSSRCSAPACWVWPIPGRVSTSGPTALRATVIRGHAASDGAYAMTCLAMITYARPPPPHGRPGKGASIGYWAFWLQLAGMFGMTISFATAGIGQVYLERIMGMGYLDAQLKIQIHFVMLIVCASLFSTGVGLFIYDFFRYRPRLDV